MARRTMSTVSRMRWTGRSKRMPCQPSITGGRRRREGRRDLLELAGVIEIVQPGEEQRLPPGERAEHRVLDPRIGAGGRVGGEHLREQGAALLREEVTP